MIRTISGWIAFIFWLTKWPVALLALAALALIPASLAAYQSVMLIPILGGYLWLRDRRWLAGWLVLVTPLATLGLWQLFERITGGAMPAEVLTGHFDEYGLSPFSAGWSL